MKSDLICDLSVRYFDFTASALGLKSVEKEIYKLLENYANTHSDSAKNSRIMNAKYQQAKARIKASLNIPPTHALIATGSGSSAAILRFCQLLGIHASPALLARMQSAFGSDFKRHFMDTLIISSALEHHSNELAYREALCMSARLSMRDFSSDLFELHRRAKDFRRAQPNGRLIIAASAASNITGVRNDLVKMQQIAREFGALLAVDATASLPYENLPIIPDAFFFSGHKFLGGINTPGFLCIRKDLINAKPTFAGGGTVEYVDRSSAEYLADEVMREESGTPPIIGVIKASLAIAHRDAVGLSAINQKLNSLKELFLKEFLKIQYKHQFSLYAAPQKNRLPIFSLNAARINPFDLARVLSDKYGIESRAGCACAGPYAHDIMNLSDGSKYSKSGAKPGFLRVGLHYVHDEDDVHYLINALAKSSEILRK